MGGWGELAARSGVAGFGFGGGFAGLSRFAFRPGFRFCFRLDFAPDGDDCRQVENRGDGPERDAILFGQRQHQIPVGEWRREVACFAFGDEPDGDGIDGFAPFASPG